MNKLVPLLALLFLTSCVMVDSKVSDVIPAAKGPKSFQGLFQNLASYRSQSVLGLYNTEYLQEYFGCFSYPERAEDVRITVDHDVLVADIRFAGGKVEQRKLTLGRDCTFKDGYLTFPQKSDATGGHDSPTLGFVGTGGARWTVDKEGRLVIIKYGAGAGTVGIIPVGAVIRWMAVFPRVDGQARPSKEVPNQSPELTRGSAAH